jgi:hypothetical protein
MNNMLKVIRTDTGEGAEVSSSDTRWLHRICQNAASQHPPERGESDWSGSLAHEDMRPVVQV